jgi:plasmid stabilization system protein ParE
VDYTLLYTQRALNDLAEIIGYIAEDDSFAAAQFGQSLLDHIEVLKGFPRMGEIVRG